MLSTGREANNHEQLNPTLLHGAHIFFSSACNHVFFRGGGGCTWMHKAFVFTYRLCYEIQIGRQIAGEVFRMKHADTRFLGSA